MQAVMDRLRTAPPASLGSMRTAGVRDYLRDKSIRPRLHGRPVEGSACDLLFFDLDRAGNAVAVRPSGTEPKLKFYLFARQDVGPDGPIEAARRDVDERLARMQEDVLKAAERPA